MKKISLILAVLLLISVLGCAVPGVAFAQELADKYTDVLTDLQKDETFDVAKFPASDEDTMDVIQVAESNDGELFLYVYAPTGNKYKATEARISTSIGDNLSPQDYKLTLINCNGTLAKYLVEDLQVLADVQRYYVIVQIARPWNKEIDGELNFGSEANTKAYEVGKQFTATTLDGSVSYTEVHVDVLLIRPEQRFDGSIRYSDGFNLYATQCDSWFVAFTCDYQINKLMDADVSFVTKGYTTSIVPFVGKQTTYEDPVIHNFTLTDKQQVTHERRFLFFKSTYTWNRIEKVEDFIKNEDLKDETKKQLENKQWVLRFTETTFGTSGSAMSGATTSWGTEVSDVTILRLFFESEGKQYNLGVVSNKVTPDSEPDNNPDNPLGAIDDFLDRLIAFFENLGKWFKDNWWIFILIGVVLVLGILSPFVPFIAMGFKAVGKGLGFVFKYLGIGLWYLLKYFFIGLYYVITSPYWLIRWIVIKVRGRKHG